MTEEKQNQPQQETEQNQTTENQQSSEPSQEDLAAQWEQALAQQQTESGEQQEGRDEASANTTTETPAEDVMADWSQALAEQQATEKMACPELEKMELLADIPVEISVEVGNTEMKLEDILNLHPNSIVELDRHINEPVDIKVNGKLVAKGELYVVEDQYGIKITQIVTPEERLKLIDY
ncbi:flagellar motor switch protein FliN [Desulfurobacterium indicum]|uniref:Flagellar motor switch protein FliN n=1 Tax=Desulfurobacterium indicum TaxID=1914305 RepID=A0A1R1MNQ8_9BACT|nr:flagellar motor switch protein FliN [Desulfurobacterium indicum]OMH41350.1 flagellar motor switch protein FliN [Desulfurobacterium indicum]